MHMCISRRFGGLYSMQLERWYMQPEKELRDPVGCLEGGPCAS
jgi:hypothetical protein